MKNNIKYIALTLILSLSLFATDESFSDFSERNYDKNNHGHHPHPVVPEPMFYGTILIGISFAIILWKRNKK